MVLDGKIHLWFWMVFVEGQSYLKLWFLDEISTDGLSKVYKGKSMALNFGWSIYGFGWSIII
jgi:hypothetical protein